MTFNFSSPVHGLCISEDNVAFTLAHSNKLMAKIVVPENPPVKVNDKVCMFDNVGL